MQIHYGLQSFSRFSLHGVVTSGTFDGVHLGHRTILNSLLEFKARNVDYQTIVITFFPHPRMILSPQHPVKMLDTMEEKAAKLQDLGIDKLVVIPFSKEFAQTTSEDYIKEILIDKLNTKCLVIGYDHHFGKNREGGFEYLMAHKENYPFQIEEIARHDVNQVGISSTEIRQAISKGDVKSAKEYLGEYYQLNGKVVKGQQKGRIIGFPTANIQIEQHYKLIPANGIYAVKVKHKNSWYDGMLNIGVRPTIADNLNQTIEAHIFNFKKEIYGDNLQVCLVDFIREEHKYPDLESLKSQLITDQAAANTILKAEAISF